MLPFLFLFLLLVNICTWMPNLFIIIVLSLSNWSFLFFHIYRPDQRVIKLIQHMGSQPHPKQKRILCINKVDLVKKKKDLLKAAKQFEDLPGFERSVFLVIGKGTLGCHVSENWSGAWIASYCLLFCRYFMISGLKGYGVKDLTQYLMEQACSCTTIIIFCSNQFTVSGIRDLWNLFCCCMSLECYLIVSLNIGNNLSDQLWSFVRKIVMAIFLVQLSKKKKKQRIIYD